MKIERTLVATAAALTALAGLATTAEARPNVRKEVAAINSAYHDAVAKRDLNAVANLYAPNARLISNAAPVKGRAAIKEHIGELFARGLCAFTIKQSELTVTGKVAIGSGLYTEKVCTTPPVNGKGYYVLVYERQRSGSLKIRYDIFNQVP